MSWVRELPTLPRGGHSLIQQFSPPGSLLWYSTEFSLLQLYPVTTSHCLCTPPAPRWLLLFPTLVITPIKPLSCNSLSFTHPVLGSGDCKVACGIPFMGFCLHLSTYVSTEQVFLKISFCNFSTSFFFFLKTNGTALVCFLKKLNLRRSTFWYTWRWQIRVCRNGRETV